jgi:hypothetical protein
LRNFHEFPPATWSTCEQETELPEQEAKKREHDSQPYPSPTHAGGLFAINRHKYDLDILLNIQTKLFLYPKSRSEIPFCSKSPHR